MALWREDEKVQRGKQMTRVLMGKIYSMYLFRASPLVIIEIPLLAFQVRPCALHASADAIGKTLKSILGMSWYRQGSYLHVDALTHQTIAEPKSLALDKWREFWSM